MVVSLIMKDIGNLFAVDLGVIPNPRAGGNFWVNIYPNTELQAGLTLIFIKNYFLLIMSLKHFDIFRQVFGVPRCLRHAENLSPKNVSQI